MESITTLARVVRLHRERLVHFRPRGEEPSIVSCDPPLGPRANRRARLLLGIGAALTTLSLGCASAPLGSASGGASLAGTAPKAPLPAVAVAPTAEHAGKQDGYRPGSEPCELDSVFFGFDAFDVDASSEGTLQRVVRCMRDSGVRRVHLTGHTDNRGTEAYNFALGDRRARSVRAALVRLGIPAGSISLSSAGEEWACGEDEAGWANDRRVDITAR